MRYFCELSQQPLARGVKATSPTKVFQQPLMRAENGKVLSAEAPYGFAGATRMSPYQPRAESLLLSVSVMMAMWVISVMSRPK